MSFFDSLNFDGGKTRDAIWSGVKYAADEQRKGYKNRRKFAWDGYGTQDRLLRDGYKNATGEVKRGYDQAFGYINPGYDRARGDVAGGFNRAIDTTKDYLQRSKNVLSPLVEQGNTYNTMLADALGVNGQEKQGTFYQDYADNDPFRSFNEEMANKSLANRMNASGIGGGRAALAMSRASLERGSQDLNRYLDRLTGQAGQGAQHVTNMASMIQNAGDRIGGYQAQKGGALGNIEIGRTGVKMNNRLGRGTTLGNMAYMHGVNRSNLRGQLTDRLVNSENLLRNNLSSSFLNAGQQDAGTRNALSNNLIGIGGALMGGFAPTAGGSSAFGNMFGGKGWFS